MKTVRIFGLPSHQTKERTSGVDFARVIQPMKHLNGYVHDNYKFEVDVYDIFKQKEFNWKSVSEKYDLVFFNYTVIDWAYAAMGAFMRGKNRKLIMDIDDALWYVNSDNIAHDVLKQVGAGKIITSIIRDIDGLTCTNLYLKNVTHKMTGKSYDKMIVLPNAIDTALYKHKSPPKDDYKITLFHYGSTSHFQDLLREDFVDGVNRIMKDYPNVYFKAIGAHLPKLKRIWGQRYNYGWGHSDIYRWIEEKFPPFMDEADIMIIPLQDNVYNRCKSDIKFIETASAMKPGVFSDIRPYHDTIEHGITGYLASTSDHWYNSIKELIDSKQKREEIGTNAYNYVIRERQIQKIIPQYAEFILKILNS